MKDKDSNLLTTPRGFDNDLKLRPSNDFEFSDIADRDADFDQEDNT